MRFIKTIATIAISIFATSAGSQGMNNFENQVSNFEALNPMIIQSEVTDIGRRMDSNDLKKILSEYGFSPESLGTDINPNSSYDVYKTAIAPGQIGIIATPSDSLPNSEGLFIVQNPLVQNASLFDAESIRSQIMDAVMASVKAACDFSVRPSRISVSASAAGIVTLELEWESAEICDKI